MNVLEELQIAVAGALSSDSRLSSAEVLWENRRDLDFQIKNALGRQGLVGVVSTPAARYRGNIEDSGRAWECDFEVDFVENPSVNRALSSNPTAQDAAMACFDVLCPPSGSGEGSFSPVSFEEGEDRGLVVCKSSFRTLVAQLSS